MTEGFLDQPSAIGHRPSFLSHQPSVIDHQPSFTPTMSHTSNAQTPLDPQDQALVYGVLSRRRRAVAKVITLIESTRRDHRARAGAVLEALLPHTGGSTRVGISGAPGSGKST